jgi:hypothetical protein
VSAGNKLVLVTGVLCCPAAAVDVACLNGCGDAIKQCFWMGCMRGSCAFQVWLWLAHAPVQPAFNADDRLDCAHVNSSGMLVFGCLH